MADQPCRPDRPVVLMLNLDKADPFVRMPPADLRPRQVLRDRRRDLLGGAHPCHRQRVRDFVN